MKRQEKIKNNMNLNDIISTFCDDAENKINAMINNIELVYILLEDDYLDKFEEAIKISNKKKCLEISLSAQHIGDIVNNYYSMCDDLLYCIDLVLNDKDNELGCILYLKIFELEKSLWDILDILDELFNVLVICNQILEKYKNKK